MPNKINFFSRLIHFDLGFNNFILKRNKNTTGINKETNTKKLISEKGASGPILKFAKNSGYS